MHRRTLLELAGAAALVRVLPANAAANPPPGALRVTRLTWAGIRLVAGETTLFVDATVDPTEPGSAPLQASTPERHALVTHYHGDHCQPEALKAVFNARSRLVCDRDTALRVGDRDVPLLPVALYQPEFLSPRTGDFAVFAVPASDGLGSPQVSWVIDGGGRRVFHAGDTQVHGHFWNIGRATGRSISPSSPSTASARRSVARRGFRRRCRSRRSRQWRSLRSSAPGEWCPFTTATPGKGTPRYRTRSASS